MGFTKTSEGRVFFQNAGNDDLPRNGSATADPVLPRDTVQMQILMLLKSLNTKLKSTRKENTDVKAQLAEYRATIKALEEKTAEQETHYIDLEQTVSRKQSEVSKKSSRVEDSVKKTLKQLEQAKDLVLELERRSVEQDDSLETLRKEVTAQKEQETQLVKHQKRLEKKSEAQDSSLETFRKEISAQKEKDTQLIKRQKLLETQQKEQGEKMVDHVAAYVALTKRVSESEARHDTLDNKIEDATSEYLKLDRKIDKAIEDRNRILRKVDRIEQAVLETRDALNAKAMVLLTDRGAVEGIDMPQITDETLQTDPVALRQRLEEEALLPWWRRPVRIEGVSLAVMMVAVLLLGWLLSEMRHPASENVVSTDVESAPVALHVQESDLAPDTSELSDVRSSYDDPSDALAGLIDKTYDGIAAQPEKTADAHGDFGIKIHNGYSDPSQLSDLSKSEMLDINDEDAVSAAFDKNPQQVARQLNRLEPSSLTSQDKADPPPIKHPAKTVTEAQKPVKPSVPPVQAKDNRTYVTALKKRIKSDPNLTDIAKKIEKQALEGVPEAQHDMGAIYVAGHGQIKKDLSRAVLWFEEAARNGVSNAKYNLGVLYHQGLGVTQNVDRAMALYHEAAEIGHPEAQYNLGIANIEGIGVPYNPSRAVRFFEMAAGKGVTEAAYNLGLIYENGLLGETRPDEALAWYKRAADQGSPEAQSALDQLAESLGIDIDDVNRIVEKLQKTKRVSPSTQSDTQSYVTSQIQKELMRLGFYPGPVDGMNGPVTANAIKSFQSSAGLDVNGHPSQELLSYLQRSSG